MVGAKVSFDFARDSAIFRRRRFFFVAGPGAFYSLETPVKFNFNFLKTG